MELLEDDFEEFAELKRMKDGKYLVLEDCEELLIELVCWGNRSKAPTVVVDVCYNIN